METRLRREGERLRPYETVGDPHPDVECVSGGGLGRDGDAPLGVAEAAGGPGQRFDVVVDDVDGGHCAFRPYVRCACWPQVGRRRGRARLPRESVQRAR